MTCSTSDGTLAADDRRTLLPRHQLITVAQSALPPVRV